MLNYKFLCGNSNVSIKLFCQQVVEEQLADENNDDIYTLSKVADIIHALFIAYKTDFFPYLDQIIGHFVKMLVSGVCKNV